MPASAPRKPVQQLFDLSGKVSLVTGARGLLGQAFAEALAEAGSRVVVSSRDAELGPRLCPLAAQPRRCPAHGRGDRLSRSHVDRARLCAGCRAGRANSDPGQQRPSPGEKRLAQRLGRGIQPANVAGHRLFPIGPGSAQSCRRTFAAGQHHDAGIDVRPRGLVPRGVRGSLSGQPGGVSRAQRRHRPAYAAPGRVLGRRRRARELS